MRFKKIPGVHYGFDIKKSGDVAYAVAPQIEALGVVRHGYSCRLGGLSKPPFDSLNLSAKREPNAPIQENFKIAAAAIAVNPEGLVVCHYAHGIGVEVVDSQHHGMGIWKENTLPVCDGVVVTAQSKETVGVTLHADCCPLFFVDRQGRAAAVCHAGWKGTAGQIAMVAMKKLENLGVAVEDIYAAVGPSISGDFYEVGEEVATQFAAYPEAVQQKEDGKYLLDLPMVNALQFIKAGVPKSQITISSMCTYTDSKLFYSHRRDGANAGAMGSFIQLI